MSTDDPPETEPSSDRDTGFSAGPPAEDDWTSKSWEPILRILARYDEGWWPSRDAAAPEEEC